MVTAGGVRRFGVMACAAAGLALCAVSGASAEFGISAGASVLYAGDYGGGLYGIKRSPEPLKIWGGQDSLNSVVESKVSVPWHGGGGSVFVDFTYLELSIGGMYGRGNPKGVKDSSVFSEEPDDWGRWTRKPWAELISNREDFSFYALNVGGMLKYPRKLSDDLTVSLAAGVNYAMIISAQSEVGRSVHKFDGKNYPGTGDISALWFKFGGIIEYDLTDIIYVRPEFLYGIRMPNKYEKEDSKDYNDADLAYSWRPLLGHGFTVKVGLGFRLL